MNDITVRAAVASDLDDICEISLQYRLGDVGDRKDGFLVSDISREEYRSLIDKSIFLVAEKENRGVVAFLLAYYGKDAYRSNVHGFIHCHVSADYVLIKQVCVTREHRRKGYGSSLYRCLFEETENVVYLSAIVLRPRNDVSISFHERLGFDFLFKCVPEDGILRGVWIKEC